MFGLATLVLCGLLTVEDCDGCSEKAVCAAHKEADAELLKSLKDSLRSDQEGERLAAYQAIGAAQRSHANGPSKGLSKALAKGVEDDSVAVRTACVKDLAEVGDPDLAVSTLVEAVEQMPTFLASLGFGGRGGGRGAGGAAGGGGGAPSDEDRQKIEEARAYAQGLVAGLASLPDDRSVKTLADALGALSRRTERDLAVPLAQALIDLGARDGIEAVVEKFVAQARAGGGGGGGRGGGGAGAGAGGGPGGGGDGGRALHGLLLRLSLDRGIEDAPEWSDEEPADWEAWFRRNRKTFAAKLGKISLASRKTTTG